EIGGRLFDGQGEPVPGAVDDRVLGMTLAQLREIDEVVGMAYGIGRAEAVRAAVTGGLVTTLVCDAPLALALLDQADEVSA
ncbi:MAG: sugar-binding domain-containing protein, partial [Actinomycetes bacterium]